MSLGLIILDFCVLYGENMSRLEDRIEGSQFK